MSAAQIYVLIALTSIVCGLWILWLSPSGFPLRQSVFASVLMLVIVAMLLRAPDPVARAAVRNADGSGVTAMIQNRQGIVHTVDTKQAGGLTTFGGNVYDGRTGFDMAVNANRLDRAYLMATLHPAPKKVLVIGLSTGAWTKAIVGMPGVEQIDIVEINPAYATLIEQNPEMRDILEDKRVRIHWDDGRRWLAANPQRRYDLIFQNTTFHWRAYVSLLVSEKYLIEAKSHLNENGIMAINTTESPDISHTVAHVFPYNLQYLNFAYGSANPIRRQSNAKAVLEKCFFNLNGRSMPAFDADLFLPGKLADEILQVPLISISEYLGQAKRDQRQPSLITDWNLITEYKYGRKLWASYASNR
jgi:predicted membrane-bound spermidine synthase